MKLRLKITKDRSIRFISHLEYARTLMRSVLRAKLPVAYSEGFNPHMKISLASALGVGVVSLSEFVEIELTEPLPPREAAARLSQVLPEGIRILDVDGTDDKAPALMSVAGGALYQITVPLDQPQQQSDLVSKSLAGFNSAGEIKFVKKAPKSKTGFREINVKEYIPQIQGKTQDGNLILRFDCRITPTGSMKAADLLRALNGLYHLELPVEKADIERLDLYRVDEAGHKQPMLDGIK